MLQERRRIHARFSPRRYQQVYSTIPELRGLRIGVKTKRSGCQASSVASWTKRKGKLKLKWERKNRLRAGFS
jgi:hypothetical protein